MTTPGAKAANKAKKRSMGSFEVFDYITKKASVADLDSMVTPRERALTSAAEIISTTTTTTSEFDSVQRNDDIQKAPRRSSPKRMVKRPSRALLQKRASDSSIFSQPDEHQSLVAVKYIKDCMEPSTTTNHNDSMDAILIDPIRPPPSPEVARKIVSSLLRRPSTQTNEDYVEVSAGEEAEDGNCSYDGDDDNSITNSPKSSISDLKQQFEQNKRSSTQSNGIPRKHLERMPTRDLLGLREKFEVVDSPKTSFAVTGSNRPSVEINSLKSKFENLAVRNNEKLHWKKAHQHPSETDVTITRPSSFIRRPKEPARRRKSTGHRSEGSADENDEDGATHHSPRSPRKLHYVQFTFVLQRKADEKLGLQIVGGTEKRRGCYIKSVRADGVAADDGRFERGDRILQVNGQDVSKSHHDEVVRALLNAGKTLELVIQRRAKKRRKGLMKRNWSVESLDVLMGTEDTLLTSIPGSSPDVLATTRLKDKRLLASPLSQSSLISGSVSSCQTQSTTGGHSISGDSDYRKHDSEDSRSVSSQPAFRSYSVGNMPGATSSVKSSKQSSGIALKSSSPTKSSSPSKSPSKSPFKPRVALRPSDPNLQERRKVGWLTKRGGGTSHLSRKNWKRRYFVLQDTLMKYYSGKPEDGDTAIGYVNLTSGTDIKQLDEKIFLVITESRTYHLQADSKDDCSHWIEVLNRICTASRRESNL